MDIFASKYISNPMENNFTKVKDFFLNDRPWKIHLLPFMHMYYDLREMPKQHLPRESCCTSGELDLKIAFQGFGSGVHST